MTGFDFNAANIEFSRECLGVEIRAEQFSEADLPTESVDIVFMCHSLEHTPFPMQYIEKAYDCLKPGGVFSCFVPNFSSLCSIEQGDNWFWLDPDDHYFHFTPRTLYESWVEVGFEVLAKRLMTFNESQYEGKNPLQYLREIYPWVADDETDRLVTLYRWIGLGDHLPILGIKVR